MSTAAVNKNQPAAPVKPIPPATDALAKARKARKTIDPNETPEKAFKRLCERRVTSALKSCKALKNLSRFKPEEKYRVQVFSAIREALALAETSWKSDSVAPDGGFRLS